MDTDDYYGILGVPSTATVEEIRRAYRSLAQTLHPDKQRCVPVVARGRRQVASLCFTLVTFHTIAGTLNSGIRPRSSSLRFRKHMKVGAGRRAQGSRISRCQCVSKIMEAVHQLRVFHGSIEASHASDGCPLLGAVLTDPRKREIFDRLGPDALRQGTAITTFDGDVKRKWEEMLEARERALGRATEFTSTTVLVVDGRPRPARSESSQSLNCAAGGSVSRGTLASTTLLCPCPP